jgi:DNA-directed RNA polymerase I subunit RPA2
MGLSEDMSDLDVGKELIRKIILVHLDDNRDKFNLLM